MSNEYFTSQFSNSGRKLYFPNSEESQEPPITLGSAINEYIQIHEARGLRPGSIGHIKLYLDPISDPKWGFNPDTPVTEIERTAVLEYLERRLSVDFAGTIYATSTRRNAINVLIGFFRWLHESGYTGHFVLKNLRPPRPDQLIIQPLTDEEIMTVNETINALSKHKLRNASVFSLMLDTGIRRSELARLKKSDLDLTNQTVTVFAKKKQRVVGFGRRTAELLSLYAGHFSSRRPGAGKDHLFLTKLGEPMTNAAVTGIFNWLKEPTGIRRLNAHITRHTFATRFLMRGGDPFALRILLGHSSLRMVAAYVRTAETTDPAIMKNNSIVDESKAIGSILRNYTTSPVVQRTLTAPDKSRKTSDRSLFIRGRKEKL